MNLDLPEAISPGVWEKPPAEQSHHTEESRVRRWKDTHTHSFDGITKSAGSSSTWRETLLVTRASTQPLWFEKVWVGFLWYETNAQGIREQERPVGLSKSRYKLCFSRTYKIKKTTSFVLLWMWLCFWMETCRFWLYWERYLINLFPLL